MVLWRETVEKVSKDFKDVTLEHLYVDNMSMQLMLNPSPYDVLLCPNTFGDILSDQCAGLTGSLGLLPSASLGENDFGLYEPAGGTAPDLVGKNQANPLAQIHSLSLLLRYSLGEDEPASLIEKAIDTVLEKGIRTRDLFTSKTQTLVGTQEMGDEIVKEMETLC
ncbi:MAG: isocitrate/isopropylmalate family dehydrogenase, partial [Bdellovibrionota bacterium]|nr:isocitrate/isopropylmalate family dehydrogenase [Bdellovibrionota bacterium]